MSNEADAKPGSLSYEEFRSHSERYEQEKQDRADAAAWREHKAKEAAGIEKRKAAPEPEKPEPKPETPPGEHPFKVKP